MRRTTCKGFTLVELIVVILLVGIISVVALPRFFSSDTFRARTTADELISALRYTQQLAMVRNINHDLVITANDFSVEQGGSPVRSPQGGGDYTIAIDNSITVTGPPSVTFNQIGEPVGGGATINVTGSGTTFDITVEDVTGYAHY